MLLGQRFQYEMNSYFKVFLIREERCILFYLSFIDQLTIYTDARKAGWEKIILLKNNDRVVIFSHDEYFYLEVTKDKD